MVIEVRNFLPDTQRIRELGLAAEYKDLKAFDGETYKRIAIRQIPGLTQAIENQMGPVLMLGQGFRLNYGNEKPNHAIHTDVGWGTHALVLYLSMAGFPGTGTAFWSSTEDDANMVELCEEEFGKAIIYRSDQPHSRWPLEAYGDSPEKGRLIAVAFFTPISELQVGG